MYDLVHNCGVSFVVHTNGFSRSKPSHFVHGEMDYLRRVVVAMTSVFTSTILHPEHAWQQSV